MTDQLEVRLEEWMQGVGRFEATDARGLLRDLEIPARRREWRLGRPAIATLGLIGALILAVGVGFALREPGPVPGTTLPGTTGTASAAPVASPSASPSASSSPAIVCKVANADCVTAIELVRSKAPEDVAGADTIVVADVCPPEVLCDRLWPFDSIVALARHGELIAAYEVTGENGPDVVGARQVGGLPAHIEALIGDAGTSGIDWGPLAVVAPSDGADTARTEGTVRISEGCVVLAGSDTRTLLVWPADRASWTPSRNSISFENIDGTTATVVDGDHAVVGGSGDVFAEAGTTFESWRDATPWVSRPAGSCQVDRYWFVGALE